MAKEVQSIVIPCLRFLTTLFVVANIIFVPALQKARAIDVRGNQQSADRGHEIRQRIDGKKTLIYQYLLGEIAWSRGELEIASEAMALAARLSEDKEIVIRAYGFAMEVGKADLAVEMAGRLLGLDVDPTRAQVMLLRAYIAANKPDEVFEILIALLEQSGSNGDLVIRYVAEALGAADNPDRWLGVMDRLAEYLPDRPEVHLACGFVAYRSGRLEKADSYLNTALQLRPDWEEAATFRLSWWNDVGKREEILKFSEEFLRKFPESSRFQMDFARLLMQWGDSSEALDQFLMVIQREPENGDAMFSAGFLYLKEKNYQVAAEMFERFLEIEPKNDQARFYLARIAREEQRYQSAMDWLLGVHGEQFRFEALLERGRIMSEQGRLDDAIAHLAGIVPRTLQEQVQIYLTEEQVLRSVGQDEQALSLLNAALVDIPDNPELLYARGLVTAKLKYLVQHERDMRRLIELQPENAHAYNALGYTLADESSRLDEALMLIQKAIELSPEDPFILDSLGWVYYRLGNYSLALENLRKAFDIRLDPEIAAHLGEVLWIQGRFDEAREVWRVGQEVKNGINDSVLDETMRRLDQ